MKLVELMNVLDVNRNVIINNDEGERIAKYDGRNSISEKYNELEVVRVSTCEQADEPAFVVEVSMPTFIVTGTFTVEVEVSVKALCEDDAYDMADSIDVGVYGTEVHINDYTDDIEIESVDVCGFDWEEAEEV